MGRIWISMPARFVKTFFLLPVFVRVFYAKIGVPLTLAGLLRGALSNIQTGGKLRSPLTVTF